MGIGDDGSTGFDNDTGAMTPASAADVHRRPAEPLGDFAESWEGTYLLLPFWAPPCGRARLRALARDDGLLG